MILSFLFTRVFPALKIVPGLIRPKYIFEGFPHSSVSKESACNAADSGSIPGLGRFPGEGSGNPLPYSCLENPMDRGAWWATVHGIKRVRHDWATKPPPTTTCECCQFYLRNTLARLPTLPFALPFTCWLGFASPQASLPEPLSLSMQLRPSCDDHCPEAWFHSAHFWTVNSTAPNTFHKRWASQPALPTSFSSLTSC